VFDSQHHLVATCKTRKQVIDPFDHEYICQCNELISILVLVVWVQIGSRGNMGLHHHSISNNFVNGRMSGDITFSLEKRINILKAQVIFLS